MNGKRQNRSVCLHESQGIYIKHLKHNTLDFSSQEQEKSKDLCRESSLSLSLSLSADPQRDAK